MGTETVSQPAKARILIVDDHPIVREGMGSFLNLQKDLHVCCEASGAEEAQRAMARCRHDLAIVDISLGDGSGLNLIQILRERYPTLAILTISMHEEWLFADRAVHAGANGYLMKQEGTENILVAVRQVLAGNPYLSAAMLRRMAQRTAEPVNPTLARLPGVSAREFEILHLIGLGFGSSEIAKRLNRSVKTVEAHRANLKKKLQLKSGQELVRLAMQIADRQ